MTRLRSSSNGNVKLSLLNALPNLDGSHLFDVNITREHENTCQTGSNNSITIRPLLLLATGAPGHIEPPWGGDWVSEHVQDMMSALQTQMNSPSDFYGEKVVIRIAEQACFNKDNSEDHNTENHMPMQRVLWEFLERLEVWEHTMRPMEVSVVQTLATGTPKLLSRDEESSKATDQENEGQRRILVLSCRAPGRSTHTSELSRPVSRTILQTIGDSAKVTFIRPGSFSALKTELESHPKGYFTAIHLDMLLVHKRPRKSEPGTHRIYFQFVNQNKTEVIEEDLKAVDKVAALLLLHGVQDVVIAPCPHARSAVETAATVLLSSGVQKVVTLAYHITENDADVFLRSLYIGYIQQKLPLEEAARAARQHLRGGEGDKKMPVCDFVVLTYVKSEWLPSTSLSVDYKSPKQEPSHPNSLYGREHDIVHIESVLLLGKPLPLLIYGMAGIGKTALLDHLSTWWKASGMIEDAIHISLCPSEAFNKDGMLQQLQHHFIPNSTPEPEDTSFLYEYFESHKCLIVIDDLDSANFNRQQGQFMNLTSKLSKSGALVILASRKRERWLSKAKVYRLSGLQTRPATLLVMDPEFRDRVTDDDDPASPDTTAKIKTQEERDCLEAVVEMLRKMYIASYSDFVQTVLLRILRSLRLQTLRINLNRQAAERDLRVYMRVRNMDQGDGFLPVLLAPFMGVLPSKDLLTIFCIWSTRVAKVLGKAASTRLVRAAIDSDVSYTDNTGLTEDARISIEALLNAAKVAEPEQDLELWPWDCWEDDREWGVVDAEIEIEFDNFASACMTGLLHIDLDKTHLMGLMRIAAVLEHGAGERFYYRKTILAQVWTVALARTLTEVKKLQDEGRSRRTEIYMFLLTALYFSSELGRFHDLNRESDEVAKYKGLIAQFAVVASKMVPENIEVKAKKHKLSGRQELERLAGLAADPDQDILYSVRGQLLSGTSNNYIGIG
ncbi:hypothetical protein H9Q69_010537 [Fusarium xylarioides]|nr:hypothetical protein H9Q69_010537 [Fusarium xylarioides]